jgi:hypothetical protein
MTMDKRAARAAYKDRKPSCGIYAVKCAASRQIWVGATPTLETIQNRIWFGLRLGNSPQRLLQQAWADHGEAQFSFVELERLDVEDKGYVLDAQLKDRAGFWRAHFKADPI